MKTFFAQGGSVLMVCLLVVNVLVARAADDATTGGSDETTTMASSMAGGESTTGAAATSSPAGNSSASCNEEEMKKQNSCCKPFVDIKPPTEAEEVVKKVIEMENAKSNKTTWSLDNIETAEKKECDSDIYKIQAKLSKTMTGENATSVDCQMRFRVAGGAEGEDSSNYTVESFCNGAGQLGGTLLSALLLPVLVLFYSNSH